MAGFLFLFFAKVCAPAINSYSQASTWLAKCTTATHYTAWAPDANLTDVDFLNLQHMCAFEIVKDPPPPTPTSSTSSPQPTCPHTTPTPQSNDFCKLFTADAWYGYEYWNDISTCYNSTGLGEPKGLGRVRGVGYVNELLSRLTGNCTFVDNDRTQVNHTVDDSAPSATFPLDRGLYADFTHDHQLITIYGAMGTLCPSRASRTSRSHFWQRVRCERTSTVCREDGRREDDMFGTG